MFDRLKKPAAPETLDATISARRAALATARESYEAAALAAQDGGVDSASALSKARAAFHQAETVLADTEAAQRPAQARAEAAARKAAEAETTRKWGETAEIAKRRDAAGKKVQRLVAELGEAFKELPVLSEQLYGVAPVKDAPFFGRSQVSPALLHQWLEMEMKRAGFKWAGRFWPWLMEGQPTFAERIAEGNRVILSKRST